MVICWSGMGIWLGGELGSDARGWLGRELLSVVGDMELGVGGKGWHNQIRR